MSLDLFDLKRLKISRETRAWLQSEAQGTGESQQDIARTALHEIALRKIRQATVLARLAEAEGHDGDRRGHSD